MISHASISFVRYCPKPLFPYHLRNHLLPELPHDWTSISSVPLAVLPLKYPAYDRKPSDVEPGRRRKIKCIFHPERPNVCNECFGRGIGCIDQESAADVQTAETRQSLRERVAQLESVVRAISRKIDVDGDNCSHGSSSGASDHSKDKAGISDLVAAASGLEHAPIMTLFNNGLIAGQVEHESPEPATAAPQRSNTERCGSTAAEEKIRQKLLAVVPSDKDIDLIFRESSQWHKVWRYVGAPPHSSRELHSLRLRLAICYQRSISSIETPFPPTSKAP